jgi:hypothetical protein
MTRADAVLCAAAVLVGANLGAYPWLLTGGYEAGVGSIWIWQWSVSVLALPFALLIAGRPRPLMTTVAYVFLSLVPHGLALADVTAASFGSNLGSASDLILLVGVPAAAVVARFVGTRQGDLPGTAATVGLAIAGLVIGLAVGWNVGGGWANILIRVIPCEGFECGMGTGLMGYFLTVLVAGIGGVFIALQLARRPRADISV